MAREWVFLECKECGTRYYRRTRKTTTQAKLELKKFCSKCRRHAVHRERKK